MVRGSVRPLAVFFIFLFFLTVCPTSAQPASEWLRRWNSEEGREEKLQESDVLFKESRAAEFETLQVAGFRQTDGTFPLGRLIWRGETYSTLNGLAAVLSDKGFSDMSDAEREAIFLSLLQQTYGLLGTKVYTGKPMSDRGEPRPQPLRAMRNVDDSHRFQVWFYEFPVTTEEGEWREVLYFVTKDGHTVRAQSLGAYYPKGERLNGFPDISKESFE